MEESVPAWQVWEHAWDFGKGLIVDGVWGTIKGLGGLVGCHGWDAFKAAWTGLGKLATGLAHLLDSGVRELYWAAPDDKLPSWLRDSRTAMKETGKALLAWDQWGSNPSRAAGAVTFNVLTTVFTGGSGGAVAGAGKAGAAARTLSFAGKAGRAIDPMTYIFKGAGAGVSKIGDVMAGLKGMGKVEIPKIDVDGAFALPDGGRVLPDGTIDLPPGTAIPEGATKLPDGTIKLPEGTATLPPGTVKLPVDGPPQFMDLKGNIYDANGSITQHAAEAPPGKPGAGADVPKADSPAVDSPATAKVPDRELVGVGGRGDDVIRVGSDISDPVRVGDDLPGGRPDTTPGGTAGHTPGGHAGDHMPTNSLDNTPRGGHADTPGTGGHADSPALRATRTAPAAPRTAMAPVPVVAATTSRRRRAAPTRAARTTRPAARTTRRTAPSTRPPGRSPPASGPPPSGWPSAASTSGSPTTTRPGVSRTTTSSADVSGRASWSTASCFRSSQTSQAAAGWQPTTYRTRTRRSTGPKPCSVTGPRQPPTTSGSSTSSRPSAGRAWS